MKIELFRRIGLTIAAFALASCTSEDLIAQQEVTGLLNTVPTTSAASSSEQRCAGLVPPHTLFLRDARGNAFQLVLCRGSGWKYVAGEKPDRHERSLAYRKIKFSPIAEAQATAAPPTEYPMAVFVDGSSGFTFAQTRDGAWKHVGYLTNEQR